MNDCTVCPFVRYWYVVLALAVVIWAVVKFVQSRNAQPIRTIAGVENLTAENFPTATASGTTLVDFWASWCGPCKAQHPIITETVPLLPPGTKIAMVNVDEAPALAQRFQVQSVPCWIVFADGREVGRAGGLQSRDELLRLARSR